MNKYFEPREEMNDEKCIEICTGEAVMLPIQEVAAQLDLTEDDLELYGKYKAKLSDDCLRRFSDQPDGRS